MNHAEIKWQAYMNRYRSRGVLRKICSENMQQIYRRTPMWSVISIKLFCNFTEIPLRYGYSPVNLLHIFRTSFYKNTYGRLLLLLSETVTIGKNFLNLSVTHSFNKQPVNKKPVVGKSNIKQFHMARTYNGI